MHRLRAALVWAALLATLATPPAPAQQRDSASLAVAESALAHRDLDRAVRLATRYTDRRPDDPLGWMILGRALVERPSGSTEHRLRAVRALRRATALRPDDREAWALMGHAATMLGGAEGESVAQQAWERVLSLEPGDRGAWFNWLQLYRSRRDRDRLRRMLAARATSPEVRSRIARLLIEDERYDTANAVLQGVLREDSAHAGALALRGQSAYESGDTTAGHAFYGRALRHADRDDGAVLWSQAVGIATPWEVRTWDSGLPASIRPGFLQSFWARRDPDLFRRTNARLAEHFARLRQARKMFPLLHPLATFQRDTATRAPEIRASVAEEFFYEQCEAEEWQGAPIRAEDRARIPFPEMGLWPTFSEAQRREMLPGQPWVNQESEGRVPVTPLLRGLQVVDTTAARVGYGRRTGLDDRGLTYLRFGPPRHRAIGAPNTVQTFCRVPDVERWDYDAIGPVRFFRPSSVDIGFLAGVRQTGDMVFRPRNEEQYVAMVASLTRERTSVPAPLPFGAWHAQFRAASDSQQVDLVVFATEERVAAQLSGALSSPTAPALSSRGRVVLTAPPGVYVLQVHAQAGDTLGRLARQLELRSFAPGPALGDLLLAPTWADTAVARSAMLARTPQDLAVPADVPLRAYAEVYGVPRDADGTARYRAVYQFYRTDDVTRDAQRDSLPGGLVLSFQREALAPGPTVVEWLDFTPDVPPGRCLLRLTVTDVGGTRIIGRTQIALEIQNQ